MSRGAESPGFVVRFNVRTEVRTYLRGEGEGEGKATATAIATATAKCGVLRCAQNGKEEGRDVLGSGIKFAIVPVNILYCIH